MTKELNKNAEMQLKEEFDRSICMSFFDDHRKLVKRIERLHGIEMAYKVQNAIIDYGLDGIKPTDEVILSYVPEPILNQIDQNQKRRSKGFQGEDLDASRSIILLHRDHPELSQNAIAKQLGVSKGKVNKTLKKYENGEYEGIFEFNDSANTSINTITSTITSMTSDQRDRMTTKSTELANAQTESASPPASDEAKQIETDIDFKSKLKSLSNKQIKYAIDKKIDEINVDDNSYESMLKCLIKEFTGAFYQCDKEAIISYANSQLLS